MIRVFNTLSKNKEPFEPVEPGKVGIYLCGPTVYKPSHIGHMVGPVIFDAVKRYLVYSGYDVKWVVNITDVDDKLINESNAREMPMPQLAAEMTADYMRNLAAMGVDSDRSLPPRTDNIEEIIRFTADLIAKGFAYESEGDVYFDVARLPGLRQAQPPHGRGDAGRRGRARRSGSGRPADFALWKRAKPGEPSWDSPWGPGRPGWHIECSVMSQRLLGETFDIHGGGLDLVFPHHENEIAQSECRHGQPMAKYWMHNGLMQASNEAGKVGGRSTRPAEGDKAAQEAGKISKSRGASPFSEMLKDFQPEAIRFFLLSTHYRRPIDFSEEPHPRGRDGHGNVLPLLQALPSGSPARTSTRSRPRPAAATANSTRPATRCWPTWPSSAAVPGGDGRRFQHGRGDRRALRPGPAARTSSCDDEKLEDPASATRQDRRAPHGADRAPRTGRHAGPVPQAAAANSPKATTN